jgi:hypothetical protein
MALLHLHAACYVAVVAAGPHAGLLLTCRR